MNTYFIIGILAVWLVYLLITRVFGKKRIGYSIIVAFVFILGFCYFFFYAGLDSEYYQYYYFGTIGFFIVIILFVNIKKMVKKSVSEYDFFALEKRLEEMSNTSELLRERFISTIEIMNDGIAFIEADGTMFGSDKFKEITGINDNEFTLEEYYKIIYKDDVYSYKNSIEKTTKKSPIYNITYRVKKDDDYIWVKEVGKLIILNKKNTYISIIKPLDIKQFPETEVEVLLSLPNYKKMYDEMQKLARLKTTYHLVIIRLTNIPKINEKYGRDVGDLMMGEYLKKLRYNFIKEEQSLYRIGGIDFGLIIKDEKKFEFLQRALTGGGDLLNLKMIFGGITQTLYPNLGISESPYEGKSADQVYEEANEALKISINDPTNKNFYYYEKI